MRLFLTIYSWKVKRLIFAWSLVYCILILNKQLNYRIDYVNIEIIYLSIWTNLIDFFLNKGVYVCPRGQLDKDNLEQYVKVGKKLRYYDFLTGYPAKSYSGATLNSFLLLSLVRIYEISILHVCIRIIPDLRGSKRLGCTGYPACFYFQYSAGYPVSFAGFPVG